MPKVDLVRDGDSGVVELVMDFPPVNALSVQTYEVLTRALEECADDLTVKVVLLRSAHARLFCAGADLNEVSTLRGDYLADEHRQRTARRAYETILDVPQVTIAVVNGPALGGGAQIAACCDLRVASTSATIGLPELGVARCGGTCYLRALVPEGVVRWMMLTGEPLGAMEAHQHGLFNQVVPPGEELAAARAVAARIAERSRHVLRLAKEALDLTENMPKRVGYQLEQRYSVTLGATHDGQEGSLAFVERRKPEWTDL